MAKCCSTNHYLFLKFPKGSRLGKAVHRHIEVMPFMQVEYGAWRNSQRRVLATPRECASKASPTWSEPHGRAPVGSPSVRLNSLFMGADQGRSKLSNQGRALLGRRSLWNSGAAVTQILHLGNCLLNLTYTKLLKKNRKWTRARPVTRAGG